MKSEKVLLNMPCILFFLLCGILLTSNPAVAADKTVCASGCDHVTIQAAIDDAFDDVPSGGTITVTDGATYSPTPLQMKTGVDVVSTWDYQVDPPGNRPLIIRSSGSITVQFASGVSNCKLKGFRVQGLSGFGFKGIVYFVGDNTGITIEDCDLYGEGYGCGIMMYEQVSATIRRCTIHDIQHVGISSYYFNSHQWKGGTIVIEDTEVYNCGVGGFTTAGIRLGDGDTNDGIPGQVTITNNCYVHDNYRAGMRLGSLSQATVENSTVENNGTGGTPGSGYGGIRIYNIGTAVISNNVIRNHVNGAGIAIEGNSAVTIGADLAASDPFLYGNDIHSNFAGIYFKSANSQPVIIRGNNIHNNSSRGGIRLGVALTGTVTITQNDIDSNNWGGISIQNNCTAVITKNNIHASTTRGGIHTGNETGAFSGTAGGANLTIRKNKVHGNLNASRGGGIDVRHASGTIENNLVYGNARGGIRYGDYVTEILHNTVVYNGQNDFGGGIIYDDPTDNVNVNDPPTGTCSSSPLIKNNISAYNEKAGFRVGGNGYGCPADNPGYDYNLLYANYPWNDIFSRSNSENCGWPDPDDMSCIQQQYGGCGAYVDPGIVLNNPNDIIDDPQFVLELDNYHLDNDSPAKIAGEGGVEMGAYGGGDPIVDSEVPEL